MTDMTDMTDEMKRENARKVFEDLCGFLDKMELQYEKEEGEGDESSVIHFTVGGDDFPIQFVFVVSPVKQLISMFSPLPFSIPEDRRLEAAVAICVASYGLPDGSFDYNLEKGTVSFRQTVAFRKSRIGEPLFFYLLHRTNQIVERYNDRLFAVGKGLMSLEEFIAADNA